MSGQLGAGKDAGATRAGLGDIGFEAEIDDFAGALHESIECFGLSVATTKTGNGGDVTAFLVLFDQDGKFFLGFKRWASLEKCSSKKAGWMKEAKAHNQQ
jgi:hypothetical protein